MARIVAAAWRARRADRMEAALMNLWMSDVPFTDELKRQVEFAYGQMRDGLARVRSRP